MEFLETYKITILALGITGFVFWIQLAIVDLIGIIKKHPPGFSIAQDHNSFIFRANRALANSNESMGILIILSTFAMLSAANPTWLNAFSITFLISRIFHMGFYYLNIKLLRSVAFAFSILSLLGIFLVGIINWI